MRYQYIPAVILDWAGTPSVRAGGCETLGAAGMGSRLRSPMRSGSSPNSCRAWRRYSPNSARPFQACAKPWTHGEPPGCARLHHGLYTGAAARGDSSGGPPRLRSGRQRDSGRSGRGRPKPFMCYRNAILLGAYPLWRCVKIGDTASDIAEGINAGMWTVGITATGNEIGLSRGDWEALPRDSRATQAPDSRVKRHSGQKHRFIPDCAAAPRRAILGPVSKAKGRRHFHWSATDLDAGSRPAPAASDRLRRGRSVEAHNFPAD